MINNVNKILGKSSFDSLTKWIDYVKEERGNDVLIYLLGNKIDVSPS